MDPNDTDAPSLRAQKSAEWISLARQHLANHSFRQAREALEQVVRMKPNDVEALELMAEIARRETQAARIREEKAALYQSAMGAWDNDEITAALSKMETLVTMDRETPEPDVARSVAYQNFYIRVRTENNVLRNAYEEAKRHLAAEEFESAIAICRQCLAKYPNHALFQSLKFDVEDRYRQKISQAIAASDRRVDEEPDLERRVAILEEALQTYPGEPHFERALKLARDKRDLVNSIVAKARTFEEKGQFDDALDQWQMLRSIHEPHPGLTFEIQRLALRRDRQSHEKSKAKWVQLIDQYLESGDYARAAQTVESALAEFAAEPELLELEKLVRKSRDCGAQALERLARAHQLSEGGSPQEALEELREANKLDPRNSVIRAVLVNSLLDQAGQAVESDWKAAEPIVREALQVDPQHAGALSLASRIEAGKREDFVARSLAWSRRLQTEGDLPGALRVVEQALSAYPDDARLQQLQATLERAQRLGRTTAPTSSAILPEVSPVDDRTVELKAAPPMEPRPAPPKPPVEMPPVLPEPRTPEKEQTRILFIGTATAVVVLMAIAFIVRYSHQVRKAKQTPVASSKFAVMVHSTPEGAEIKINGQVCGPSPCRKELPAGTYSAEAQLTGYQPAALNIPVGNGASLEPNMVLQPLPPRLAIFTDLAQGTVTLDGTVASQIQDGGAEVPNLAAGQHTIAVQGGDSVATIPVDIAPGRLPKLTGAMDAKNARAFVVAGFGAEAYLFGTVAGAKVTLDGKPLSDLNSAGVQLPELAAGGHELAIDSPMNQHDKIMFEAQPSPTIYISLGALQNVGWLTIATNEDQAQVYINGKKYGRDTRRGQLAITLAPGRYAVSVQKEGFAPTPEQTVEIKRSAVAKVSATLQLAKATLKVHGTQPGSEILIDGNVVGQANAGGEFQIGTVEPGRHSVVVRHERFKPIQSEQIFTSGKTVDVPGTLEAVVTSGTVRFEITPPGLETRITVRREDEAQEREVPGASASLPEGTYVVTASAGQYQPATARVRVSPGGTAVAALVLHKLETAKAPAKTAAPTGFGLDEWLKAGGWTQKNGLVTRRGGDFVLAPGDLTQGTVTFTVLPLRGKRVEWVAGYRDAKNYCFFQMDDKNLTRYEVYLGSKGQSVKLPHGLDKKEAMSVSMSLHAGGIAISVYRGGQWVALDKWDVFSEPVRGKFGFHISGGDEIGLQAFKLTGN